MNFSPKKACVGAKNVWLKQLSQMSCSLACQCLQSVQDKFAIKIVFIYLKGLHNNSMNHKRGELNLARASNNLFSLLKQMETNLHTLKGDLDLLSGNGN